MHQRRSLKMFLGTAAIHALTLAALWGRFQVMGWVAVGIACIMAFNLTFVHKIFPKFNHSFVDDLRSVLNVIYPIAVGHFAGWVLPNWLWMPFTALAETGLDARRTRISVAFACIAEGGFAVFVDRAPPLFAITFAMVALMTLAITEARMAFVVELLEESDKQQIALQTAHEQLEEANEKIRSDIVSLQKIEIELRQAQKLEAVGRLASGIAHEINTPTQFVTDSVHFLNDGLGELLGVIEKQRQAAIAKGGEIAAAASAIHAEADIAYLADALPKAVERARDGLRRVSSIVRSMKRFAHPDQELKAAADINEAIESTLTIARNEYKYVADLELDLSPLPRLTCHLGELNQVVLNLVVNAAHAIADVVGNTGTRGKISVGTRREGDEITISVADTGTGIRDELKDRIFDPFFTTKEVGRGTGQGLAIARSVVVDRHGGKLTFSTVLGQGTTFFIRLPMAPADAASRTTDAIESASQTPPSTRRAAS